MAKPESQYPTPPAPRNRDYAEGWCAALEMLCDSIDVATLRSANKELAGLESASNLSKQIYDAMRAHLKVMTGEAVPAPTPEGPTDG